jgi:hypothetical protein
MILLSRLMPLRCHYCHFDAGLRFHDIYATPLFSPLLFSPAPSAAAFQRPAQHYAAITPLFITLDISIAFAAIPAFHC